MAETYRLRDSRTQILWAALASLAAAAPWLVIAEPLAPLVALLGIGAVTAAIAYPAATSLLFVVFSYFRIHEAYPILVPLSLPLGLATLSLVSLFWNLFVSKAIRPFWTRELGWLALFFVLVTVGIIFAIDRRTAFEFWSSSYWKIVLMAFAIAWLIRTPRDLDLAAKIIIAGGVLIALVAIYNKSAGLELVEETRVSIGRSIGSSLGDPNDLALILILPLAMAGALVLHRTSSTMFWLGVVACSTISLAIVFTQSRGGLLGVAAVAGVLGYRLFRSRLLAATLAIVFAFGLYNMMGISERRSGGEHEVGIDQSAAGRLEAWGASFKMVAASPLTGVGVENFGRVLFLFIPKRSQAAHSTWFGVLGETGIPGFIVFVAMVATTLGSNIAAARLLLQGRGPPVVTAFAMGLLAAHAGFLVSGSFLSHGFTWPVYVLVGLTVAVKRCTDAWAADAREARSASAVATSGRAAA